jgi:hypothetical protein
METPSFDLSRVDFWTQKFRTSLEKQQRLATEINPGVNLEKVREEFLLSKLATLMVGCEALGAEVRELKAQLHAKGT